MYKTHASHLAYDFKTLRNLMAKASPIRSGDYLAGVGAVNNLERVAAQWALADVALKQFLNETLVPYEQDEVTRLIIDEHDSTAFAPVSHLTVGDFRNWLLSEHATTEALTAIAQGLTPEMVAAYKIHTTHLTYDFKTLRNLMAKASPSRSGDYLAGVGAVNNLERVAAQWALAEVPLKQFLNEALVPYEQDEITRLIIDEHDSAAFAPVSHLTVGDFRNWLLSGHATTEALTAIAQGLTPEMVAAVSKIMRIQDLILVAKKCRVITRFRGTIGLENRLSTRLQPNHPTDNPAGVAASLLDGLLYGCGDAVIGINPASDNLEATLRLLHMLHDVIERYQIPTQSCVLAHVTTTLKAIEQGAPVDLVFQSIAGTQKANDSFGINLNVIKRSQTSGVGTGARHAG